jgi:hypothetical protein
MARNKKVYQDDDGRTIADMSGVSRPRMLIPGGPGQAKSRTPEPEQEQPHRPWEEQGLTRQERRWYMLGALKAALLIALAFIVGLGVVILILLMLWS